MAGTQPDPLRKIRHDIASVQAICASIDNLAESLPEAYRDQVDIIRNAVSVVRVDSKADLESHATTLFTWNKLPGEVKNEIYKLLLVSDEPIRPYVCNPGNPSKRFWHKPGLQGQVLRLSKTVYKEALPILLGDNTFVLTNSLDKYLGFGLDKTVAQLSQGAGTPPPDRANMVHRVVFDYSNVSEAQMTTLRRLKSLRELIFVHHGEILLIDRIDSEDWEATCAGDSRRFERDNLIKYASKRKETKIYFISTRSFYHGFAERMVRAFKWRLEPNGLASWRLSLVNQRRCRPQSGYGWLM